MNYSSTKGVIIPSPKRPNPPPYPSSAAPGLSPAHTLIGEQKNPKERAALAERGRGTMVPPRKWVSLRVCELLRRRERAFPLSLYRDLTLGILRLCSLVSLPVFFLCGA